MTDRERETESVRQGERYPGGYITHGSMVGTLPTGFRFRYILQIWNLEPLPANNSEINISLKKP